MHKPGLKVQNAEARQLQEILAAYERPELEPAKQAGLEHLPMREDFRPV